MLFRLGLITLLTLAMTSVAFATSISSSPHISLAGQYNYVVTGGSLRTQSNNNNPCALDSGLQGQFVDAGTVNASISGIPGGSNIVGAYLYFIGDGETPDYTVTFNGISVTASPQYNESIFFGGDTYKYYGGFVDVTSLVTGNGSYSFGGLSVQNQNEPGGANYCSSQGVIVGWSLVVVYENTSTEPLRVINIFDGLQLFYRNSITLTPSNFQIPSSPINGKMTVIAWGGDDDIQGPGADERLEFNNNALSDGDNPVRNPYNATINTLGVTTSWGVDIDTFDISSYLNANDTSATTFYSTGDDDNYLTAQIISVTNTPVADLAISKTHSGNLVAGQSASYQITVHNNGPSPATGTTTVTDNLPTGLSFVSANGTGWACSFSNPTVTCTTNNSIASSANAPVITLNVNVATSAPTSISNTASVANNTVFDNIAGNNSSTDTANVLRPDLSTSTKTVVDQNGGDAAPGDILRYTITLNESSGLAASNIQVTDDIPANITNFTVINNAGGTDNSTTSGGANGTGFLDISNISVPASGSKTIVFDVTIAASAVPGTTINNTATVNNPSGPDASPAAPTIIVLQSQTPSTGNKIVYMYSDLHLSRTPQTGSGGDVVLNWGNGGANPPHSRDWILTTALAKPLTINANSNVTVSILAFGTYNQNPGGQDQNCDNGPLGLTWTAELYDKNGAALTQIGNTANGSPYAFDNGQNYEPATASIDVTAATTIAAGHQLLVRIESTGWCFMHLDQWDNDDNERAYIRLDLSTVINVDDVSAYSVAYPSTTQASDYRPNGTVYLRAVVSDPFGSYDIDPATGGVAPSLTIKDADGTDVDLNGAAAGNAVNMPEVNDSGAATKTFEYVYTLPTGTLQLGSWTASVLATEGNASIDFLYNGNSNVTHTANELFDVHAPNPVLSKSARVLSDPTGMDVSNPPPNNTPHALPGAIVEYTILVSNTGLAETDGGSLDISDMIGADTAFVVGSVTFTDGLPTSGLSVSASNIQYCNGGTPPCTYTPVGTTDPNVTQIIITPSGTFTGKANSTAPAPNFTIKYQVQLQ